MPLSFVAAGHASALDVPCAHCAAAVPARRFKPGQAEQFCCAGCDTVFHLLKDSGLDDYYAYRDRLGEATRPVDDARTVDFQEFDSTSYRQLYCQDLPDQTTLTSFVLEGVHCAACVWLVERVSRLQPAVTSARLDIARARVDVTFRPDQARLSDVARAFARLGYAPRPFRAKEAERARQRELRSLLLRVGVAGATAGNVMLMAFALYSGELGLQEAGTMDPVTRRFFELSSLVVSLAALWAGGLFFRGAWASLRTRTPHMDLPIALGILGAYVWGAYGALTGAGHLYFDSITTLVFLLLVGRYIQRRHQMAFSEAAELVHAVLPSTATILEGDTTAGLEAASRRDVPRDEIVPAMRVLVKAGGIVPVDGVVLDGQSHLDKSLLSGESRPLSVAPGDAVEAGAINLGQTLVVQATARGADARVAKLMHEVERALSTKTPLTGQADRIAGVFTLSVIALAVLVGAVWWSSGPERAIEHALSVLIVACPCALGMATPLSLSAAVRRAARAKKFIFAPEALERLGRPADIVLDKTGTLTWGRLRVLGYDGERSVLRAVEAMETDARHPVARAMLTYIAELHLTSPATPRLAITELRCQGLRAIHRGRELVVGSETLARSVVDVDAASLLQGYLWGRPAGASPVFVVDGGRPIGRFWVGDEVRPDAAASLLQLKAQGHRLHLLSGDHPDAVAEVAAALGQAAGDSRLFVSVRGGASPEEKLGRVQALSATLRASEPLRPVVMVGDGVNDAGALAAADVGVAVDGAAEASRLSAHVFLPLPGVRELLHLTEGARRTLRTIRRGIVFSIAYNVVGISCAAAGILGPLGAALLMPISSLTVVTNAFKSRTFVEKGLVRP